VPSLVRTSNSCIFIDPFEAQSLPTSVRATLEPQEQGAVVVLARFDTTGRFVAAGLRDGRAWLWDLETQAVVRHFEGHVKMVTGLSYVRFFSVEVLLS
jgi:COMPASS component SWD1